MYKLSILQENGITFTNEWLNVLNYYYQDKTLDDVDSPIEEMLKTYNAKEAGPHDYFIMFENEIDAIRFKMDWS